MLLGRTNDLEDTPFLAQRLLDEELDTADRDRDGVTSPPLNLANVNEVLAKLVLRDAIR